MIDLGDVFRLLLGQLVLLFRAPPVILVSALRPPLVFPDFVCSLAMLLLVAFHDANSSCGLIRNSRDGISFLGPPAFDQPLGVVCLAA